MKTKRFRISHGVVRWYSEFYYLQTYLQAKYPDFKWPDLPIQNVLTSDEENDYKTKREKYMGQMKILLDPKLWKEHSAIQKIICTFCTKGKWKGAKWYSYVRIYIVLFVDTAGRYTAPDLLAFIVLLILYGLFIPCVLKYVSNWSWLSLLFAFILSLGSFFIKYKKMYPPELWDRTTKSANDDSNIPLRNRYERLPD